MRFRFGRRRSGDRGAGPVQAAGGVVLLTLAARMHAFGKIPVSFLLYALLVGYGTLVVYELRLLEEILFTP